MFQRVQYCFRGLTEKNVRALDCVSFSKIFSPCWKQPCRARNQYWARWNIAYCIIGWSLSIAISYKNENFYRVLREVTIFENSSWHNDVSSVYIVISITILVENQQKLYFLIALVMVHKKNEISRDYIIMTQFANWHIFPFSFLEKEWKATQSHLNVTNFNFNFMKISNF